MNRITEGIAKFEKIIADKLAAGTITEAKCEKMRNDLDMEFDEYFVFQNQKSIAQMEGRLSLEEAQTVYMYLGEGGVCRFNNQSLPVKYVLTEVLSVLLRQATEPDKALAAS